jgi:hypothetical protein
LARNKRSAVQMQDVERPELDAGRARPVLHLAETGHAGLRRAPPLRRRGSRDGRRDRRRALRIGVFVGDVAAAP